jgi:hypothetical protein
MIAGETILTGAPDKCPDCGNVMPFQVCMSGAGYYIGTECCMGPNSRETGYYPTRELAQADLDNNSFTPRNTDFTGGRV